MENSQTSETLKQAQCIVINVQSSHFADVIVPVVQGTEAMHKIMKIKAQIQQLGEMKNKTSDQQELVKQQRKRKRKNKSNALEQSKKQLKDALLESTVFLLVQCRNKKANNAKVSFCKQKTWMTIVIRLDQPVLQKS